MRTSDVVLLCRDLYEIAAKSDPDSTFCQVMKSSVSEHDLLSIQNQKQLSFWCFIVLYCLPCLVYIHFDETTYDWLYSVSLLYLVPHFIFTLITLIGYGSLTKYFSTVSNLVDFCMLPGMVTLWTLSIWVPSKDSLIRNFRIINIVLLEAKFLQYISTFETCSKIMMVLTKCCKDLGPFLLI